MNEGIHLDLDTRPIRAYHHGHNTNSSTHKFAVKALQ